MVYLNEKQKKSSNRTFALLSTIFVLLLFAVGFAEAAPASLANELSPKHVFVPGTEAYFVPAPGLALSKQFDGFASTARKIEVIVANIKEPYATILEGFTDEALKTRGVEVKSRGSLAINGAEGVLIKALHIDGANKWAKWILLLDCGGRTLVVNGVFASGDDAAAKDVETMIKSVVILRGKTTSGDMEAGNR